MIYVIQNNEQSGPHSEDEVRQKLTSGDLLPTDFAWKEGMSEWQPLANILHLQAETVSASQSGKIRRKNILIFSGLGCLGSLGGLVVVGALLAAAIWITSATAKDDYKTNIRSVMSSYGEACKKFVDQSEQGVHISVPARNFAIAMKSIETTPAFSKCPQDFRQAFAKARRETETLANTADSMPKSIGEGLLTGILNGLAGEADGGMSRMAGDLGTQFRSTKASLEELDRVAREYVE